ncbi:MAG: GNAT family N-acetyltransferase [Alphaproteobacteria bacterium]|nr:GNAT family N-acetyltransferase [Alphaproteobacteria bacterium]
MSPFSIPTLRTARLTLRAFRSDDLPVYAAMLGDPAVAGFLGTGRPRSAAESWEAMARALGQWALRGFGLFAIEHDGMLVGHVGVLKPSNWPAAELAYAIAPAMQRRGFAAEAANAVRGWAAARLGLKQLVSYIRPTNDASIALVRRLGAAQEPDIELLGIRAQVWRHGSPPSTVPAEIAATVIDVPVLETARLRLRRFEGDDYAAVCEMHADPETMRFHGDGGPRDPALSWAQMAMWTGAHALKQGGWFAVLRREDGTFVGRVGVNMQPAWPEPELAYTFARPHWGQGYAPEAAAAVRDWAWRTQAPATLVSLIKPDNKASIRVAEKLGARNTGTIEFEGKPNQRWEYPPAGRW